MTKPILYALDFDGVICDSAFETGMAGWKAAAQLWPDMPVAPPEGTIAQFKKVRPMLETGYEAILILRLLFEGETSDALLSAYAEKIDALVNREHLEIKQLKKLFSEIRDVWIRDHLNDWLQLNPLFPGIAEKLQSFKPEEWYILTTKQERYVIEILKANQIDIAEARIFGLDRNIPKDVVLMTLLQEHSAQSIYFIEDRLPALEKVKQNSGLNNIHLQLATWGYNTEQDRTDARRQAIELIDLEKFIQL